MLAEQHFLNVTSYLAAQAALGGTADLYAAASGQARVPVYGNNPSSWEAFTLIVMSTKTAKRLETEVKHI